jgi:hypothetical protein
VYKFPEAVVIGKNFALFILFSVMFLQFSDAAFAQNDNNSAGNTVLIAPNTRYEASGIQRFFFGDHYRDAWSTPSTFPVLDLKTFAGGLTPLKAGGGGKQTKILQFEGADGKRYAFRSVDKDPTAVLPEAYRETVAADILQDQISASHPMGALISDYLEERLDILHARPHFFVLPDDPALGQFRAEFGGMLGMLVERPGDHVREEAIFAGADEVGDGNISFNLTRKTPAERVDTRELLKARLLDILIGDWDRHRWQWRWAKINGDPRWKPIPEDRDQAFSKLDGLLPAQAHYMAPQLIGFREKYPRMFNLHFNGREVDRRFLVDLEKSAWDSVALAVQAQLTDAVIEEAVRQLPPEAYQIDGANITQKLKTRRDQLPEAAAEFYSLLAREVEIHTSDVAEEARITRLEDGRVEIQIAERIPGAKPYYRRRFSAQETKEVRLRLHDGNDLAVVNGLREQPIKIRIIGGPGDDELRYETSAENVHFYDQSGNNRITPAGRGGGAKINSKPYQDWEFTPQNRAMPMDWGHRTIPITAVGYTSDYGFLLGGGLIRLNYGFRKDPYAQSYSLQAAATSQGKFHFRFKGESYWENSSFNASLLAQASQLGVIRYFGAGNDTENIDNADFYKVDRWQIDFDPALTRSFGKGKWKTSGPAPVFLQPMSVSLGIDFTFSSTREEENTFLASMPGLYGAEEFSQAGLFLNFNYDTRNILNNPSKGQTLRIRGGVYPEILDVERSYGFADALGSIYVGTDSIGLRPVLALRLGGKKIWGDFPYFNSAFIGGRESLRGFDQGRFAGDASLYAGGDFRFRLLNPRMLSITDMGLFGFSDTGRVWLNGDSPGDWHWGYGGGLWLAFIGMPNTISLAIGKSPERTSIYIWYGFAF